MIVHPLLVFLLGANALLSGPVELNRSNCEVTFTVDSTWHEIHGSIADVRGKVWLERPSDFNSLKVDVQLPVAAFDTDNGRRDTRMREVLLAEQFPEVRFEGALQPGCDIAALGEGAECQSSLDGKLTIRGTERPAVLKVRVTRRSGALDVTGSTTLNWADFNVEDPSILVARLDRAVQIHVHTVFPE